MGFGPGWGTPLPRGHINDMSDADPAETFRYAAQALNRFGLAYLHVVETAQNDAPAGLGAQGPTELLRAVYNGTLMTNGEYTRTSAEAVIREGRADLVSFGRLYLANPDLAERFAGGAPLNAPDLATFYGGGAAGYTDYPTLDELSVLAR